jgi:hypothetical protein
VADVAGNSTTAGPVTGIKVDKKGPTGITFSGAPATVTLGSTFPTVTCAATDGGSGLASCVVTGQTTSSVGMKTLTATATDAVGNESTATLNYSVVYDFSGFFAPVDNLPTRNTVKAGRAIPVKFKLGGDQGLDIFGGAGSIKPNAAKAPVSTSTTCVSATLDTLESTLTAGGSSLQYDASTQTYTYVWKTDAAWAGHCRIFELNLNDGTSHRFSIAALK